MAGQGLLREARAGVFALMCLGVSAALHAWVSGAPPAPLTLLTGFGLVWLIAVPLAREHGFVVIAPTMLAAQGGLHYLFHAAPSGRPMHHAMTGSGPLADPVTPWGQLADDPSVAAGLMIGAHVAAGLLAAAWLRGGEVAVGRIHSWLGAVIVPLRLLFAVLGLTLPATGYSRRWVSGASPVPVVPLWRHSVVRRGPPVAACA